MNKSFMSMAMLLILTGALCAAAQGPEGDSKKESEAKPATETTPPPKEETSVTDHSIRVGSETIAYKATAGTILLKDDGNKPTASVFYVAYTRSDIKDSSSRPLAFLYNGGPGSSSVWIHMGAFGPRRVSTADARPTPPPPYRVEDNPNSLISIADLVFVDPVGTGFSKAVGKAKDKDFWGIDQDVKSLAQFINTYVSRNNRWNSPKFLIGESYGTFRNAALVNYLQSHDGMDFNGVVMMSTVLDLGTISFGPGDDLPYILYLPSYAATAYYHKMLKDPPADLNAFLTGARHYAATTYANALIKGASLGEAEKAEVAKEVAHFTGLGEDYIKNANLRVNLPQFMAELQRSRGLVTGRLDARFSGPTFDPLAEYGQYDPQETAISGAFTAAFNMYVREDLKFGKDQTYEMESEKAGDEWDWKHEGGHRYGFPGAPNVEGDLTEALVSNAHLKVQVENGLYDLATPFFGTEYTMGHLRLPESLESHIHLDYYDAGHMMYLRDEDLAKLKNNVATFIQANSGH
ncbi:MAG: S10 family peptidase [Terriglobia bacterium]